MQHLIEGLHQFRTDIFSSQRELFERLAHGQRPETLFITCSDSRVNPNLLTQTGPGELFILRNAGNIVPPAGAPVSGSAATIEYAVEALGVRDIIVCGHSLCGAMDGLLRPEQLERLPLMQAWLSHARKTGEIVRENYRHLSGEALLMAAIAENVLVQLEHLRSYPVVSQAIDEGRLTLHGWVYKFQTAEVFAYDPEQGQFTPLAASLGSSLPGLVPSAHPTGPIS
ncbi:MAG: carbonic anhydrase [Armatimonadota bacterium]